MQTRRWWGMLALCTWGVVGFAAASRAQAAERKGEVVEAEMLRDLDLLRETNMAQQGEFFRRMQILERLRLLESLGYLESSALPDPATKEGK